jgi:hypothetical protein
MQKIEITRNVGELWFKSPYNETLVEEIKEIDRNFRRWEKPYWIIVEAYTHDDNPVLDYLNLLGEKYSAKLDIPFIRCDLSPMEAIEQGVNVTVERFGKLKALLDSTNKPSFSLEKIGENRLAIRAVEKLESDDYNLFRALADEIDENDSRTMLFDIGDTQVIELWTSTGIVNRPLLKLQQLESFTGGVYTALDYNDPPKKYLGSRTLKGKANTLPAIMDSMVINVVSVDILLQNTARYHRGWATEITQYHLEDDLIRLIYKPEEVSLNLIKMGAGHDANKYQPCAKELIEWFIEYADKLIAIGVDMAPYSQKFKRIQELRNQTAIDFHATSINNAIEDTKAALLRYSKDDLLDEAKKKGADAKKSWSKSKVLEAMSIDQEYALAFLKIPDAPTLLDS